MWNFHWGLKYSGSVIFGHAPVSARHIVGWNTFFVSWSWIQALYICFFRNFPCVGDVSNCMSFCMAEESSFSKLANKIFELFLTLCPTRSFKAVGLVLKLLHWRRVLRPPLRNPQILFGPFFLDLRQSALCAVMLSFQGPSRAQLSSSFLQAHELATKV